jgi:ATP-dependent DNA helicase RecG
MMIIIIKDCQDANLPAPEWESNPGLGVRLTLRTPQVTPQVEKMVLALDGDMSRGDLMEKLGIRNHKHFRENYLQIGVELGLIEMTIPDKPTSSKQKYRLTEKGKLLAKKG